MAENQTATTGTPESVLFQSVRGYYETKALLAAWRLGLLQRACDGEPLVLDELANDGAYDAELLGSLLDYLTVRGFLHWDHGTYTLTQRGKSLSPYFGYLGTMVGAYEPVMAEVEELLKGTKVYGTDVRRRVPDLANGLTSLEDNLMEHFPTLLGDKPVRKVMDIGCGSGRMLCRIVRSRPEIVGVGVDPNEEICAVARETAKSDGIADRVTVVVGDAGEVSGLPAEALEGVDVITIMFVLHELLRQRGREGVLTCLRDIRAVLARTGGTLLAVEVEGTGDPKVRDDLLFNPEYEFTHVLTHQKLTTKDEWNKLANEAGLRVERIEPLRMCKSFCMVLTPAD